MKNIRETLSQSIFDRKVITAIGLSEWDQMRWDGGSAAAKKDIINSTDFVFTSSASPAICLKRREELIKQGVNCRLLDCSDAHFYSESDQTNRLGNVNSWLKADLTFQGLRRVVQRYDDRVYIGLTPPKHLHIQKRKSKYLQSIEIRKKETSSLGENWFDTEIPINSELVAIIGNQGSGKSALTDIISLCGNSKVKDYSFLTEDKFCDRQNKAREFEAKLTWQDGFQVIKSLDEKIKESEVERIRYVPQGFFEAVTNETVVSEGGRFYGEIKKAIFSHIPESDRLECSNLDELIKLRTNEILRKLNLKRQELRTINVRIVNLENECGSENVEHIIAKIKAKEAEITALINEKPADVEKPKENEEASSEIIALRTKESEVLEKITKSKKLLTRYKRQREILKQTTDAITNEVTQFDNFIKQKLEELADAGISLEVDFNQYVSVNVDTSPLMFAIEKIETEISTLEELLDRSVKGNLTAQLDTYKSERERLEAELLLADQEYQKYLDNIDEWQRTIDLLNGSPTVEGSLNWLKNQQHQLTIEKPLILKDLEKRRQEICIEIYGQLLTLASISKDLSRYIQEHIRSNELTREKYKIDFRINLVVSGFEDKLFGIIKQGSGTFSGRQEGRERLFQLIKNHDFNSKEDLIDFVNNILNQLKSNYKYDPPQKIELSQLVKSGFEVMDVYNLLFGLEYIQPQYSLSLNGKPLKQLSPGDRGILLLVFYLVVDKGDEPLIIDQPEGNLNNQSIFENLVPVFNDAKNRRQIIIVTHNPNLAVVCDAEQIIYASIDLNDGNRVIYESGALENPIFNKLSIDVLEGTPPAFDARRLTYNGNL